MESGLVLIVSYQEISPTNCSQCFVATLKDDMNKPCIITTIHYWHPSDVLEWPCVGYSETRGHYTHRNTKPNNFVYFILDYRMLRLRHYSALQLYAL